MELICVIPSGRHDLFTIREHELSALSVENYVHWLDCCLVPIRFKYLGLPLNGGKPYHRNGSPMKQIFAFQPSDHDSSHGGCRGFD